MTLNREFQDILNEKLGQKEESPSEKSQFCPKETERFQPILNFFESAWHFTSPRKINKYPSSVRGKKFKVAPRPQPEKSKAQSTPEKMVSVCELDENGQKAHRNFVILGAQFAQSHITAKMIKCEYRRLVKIYHPDLAKNPSNEKFQALILSHRVLTESFEKLQERSVARN